jgi:glycosyltransferase involved in cell wall biosynthesis
MKDVTCVICTLDLPKAYLEYKHISKFAKLVFVSPHLMYLPGKNIVFLQDPGKGLGEARQIALDKCDTKYILYYGDDNEGLSKEGIVDAIEYLENHNWVGGAFLTRLNDPKSYFEKCNDIRWKYRFKPGESRVIGTPWIYNVKILKKFGFTGGYCDDTELGQELENYGYRQGFLPFSVYESLEASSLDNLRIRYYNYGKSDRLFYRAHKGEWGILRKLKSIFHPLTCEFIPHPYYIPFYVIITFWRYMGWLKTS